MPRDDWLRAKRKQVGMRVRREQWYGGVKEEDWKGGHKRQRTRKKRRAKLISSSSGTIYERLKKRRPSQFPRHIRLETEYYFNVSRWQGKEQT